MKEARRLSVEARDELRRRLVGAIPASYSPWAHLAVPSVLGLVVIGLSVALLRGVQPWQWATVPLTWALGNATEWRAHRDLLHRRTPPFQVLYDRHTPQHHMIYVTDDMAIRSFREARLVLIPAYGIALIAVATAPLAAALWWLGQRNLACLFMATNMAYVLSYEWLHLSYHLPPESRVGRLRLVRALRRHHAVHHDPELMQRWNFNVTVPLWDLVRRTIYRAGSPRA